MLYSQKIIEHFQNPRNIGRLEKPDGVGLAGNIACGDEMKMYITIKKPAQKNQNDIIENIKFETLGCAAAIATSSMITEMAKGKTIEEALKIGKDDVAEELEGLSPIKMHCSNMAEEALKKAIEDYLKPET